MIISPIGTPVIQSKLSGVNQKYVSYSLLSSCLLLFPFLELLWRPPEYLRGEVSSPTKSGDMYAAGIVMQEIILRSGPFEFESGRMTVTGNLILEYGKQFHNGNDTLKNKHVIKRPGYFR